MRVVLLKDYAQSHFPTTPLLNYAIEVEKITTSKVSRTCYLGCGCGLIVGVSSQYASFHLVPQIEFVDVVWF